MTILGSCVCVCVCVCVTRGPAGPGAKNADYQIKFNADRIVYAPYWYSQLMLSESHQPHVVGGFHEALGGPLNGSDRACHRGDCTATAPFADWMAAVSPDKKTLVIRTQSPNDAPIKFSAALNATSG
eukprot:SAG22_NODE_5081_length_1090_cov_2.148335_1_plen_126_part_10